MAFSVQLNQDQQNVLDAILRFWVDPTLNVLILCGSAGTGKTTLIAEVVKRALAASMTLVLLAPTGRAARIMRGKIEQLLAIDAEKIKVSTIHGTIYYLADFNVDDSTGTEGEPSVSMVFPLKKEEDSFDLVIVDEASMLGNTGNDDTGVRFGSTRLLDDLIKYLGLWCNEGERNKRVKVIFVGDLAQLLPVHGNESPALCPAYLEERYGLRAERHELTTVVRQAEGSDTLKMAYEARRRIFEAVPEPIEWPFGDAIQKSSFDYARIRIASAIQQGDSVVAVVRSNEQAARYNAAVRCWLWRGIRLFVVRGDILLVVKNNPRLDLANGDLVRVMDVALKAQRFNIRLPDDRQVVLSFRDIKIEIDLVDGRRVSRDVLILENLLHAPARDLSDAQRWALVEHVRRRYPSVDANSEAFKDILSEDPYYCALQVKFGYALTCHKAQGGEWGHVIVDPGERPLRSQNDWRWFYTAVTRAKERLTLVNM